MCPYELKNGVNFAQFCFGESGLLPVFENQKWAEKFGCIF